MGNEASCHIVGLDLVSCVFAKKMFGGRERGSGEKMQREGKEPFVGASKQRPDPGRSLNDDTLGPEALCARLQLWKLFGATDPGFRFLGTRNKDY